MTCKPPATTAGFIGRWNPYLVGAFLGLLVSVLPGCSFRVRAMPAPGLAGSAADTRAGFR